MEYTALVHKQSHRLIFLGLCLLLLGLITGLLVPALANPRMAVSSHIEGVLNGMLLIIFGLIWPRMALSQRWFSISFWLAIFGTFMNWLGILVAAIFDAGAMLNVLADGKEGPPAAEGFVTFSLLALSVAMIMVSVTILIGLHKGTQVD